MSKCICINPPNKYYEKGKTYEYGSIIDGKAVYLDNEYEQYYTFGEIQWYWYFKPAGESVVLKLERK